MINYSGKTIGYTNMCKLSIDHLFVILYLSLFPLSYFAFFSPPSKCREGVSMDLCKPAAEF